MSQDIRSVLHSAYTFVRSIEENKSIASLTLDHLIQAQIDSLQKGSTTTINDGQGQSVGSRPSRFDQLDALLTSVNNAIQVINQAGDDPAKLDALGIFEADSTTVSQNDQSSQSTDATSI